MSNAMAEKNSLRGYNTPYIVEESAHWEIQFYKSLKTHFNYLQPSLHEKVR